MERKKVGRPKGSKTKTKREYAFTFDGALKGMKKGDVLYSRKEDKDITSRTTSLGLKGKFKTERVLVVKMKSGEIERGTLITRI